MTSDADARFDRLLKAMTEGEPHKVEKRKPASASAQEPERGPGDPSAPHNKSTSQ